MNPPSKPPPTYPFLPQSTHSSPPPKSPLSIEEIDALAMALVPAVHQALYPSWQVFNFSPPPIVLQTSYSGRREDLKTSNSSPPPPSASPLQPIRRPFSQVPLPPSYNLKTSNLACPPPALLPRNTPPSPSASVTS